VQQSTCAPNRKRSRIPIINNVISKITDNEYTVMFRKHHATINRSDGSVALTVTKCNDLYIVNDRQERAILMSEKRDKDLIKWHQRYGHWNVNDLKNMKNNDIVFGMKSVPQTSEINCEICAKCKIHIKPFKPSTTRRV